jgi:hypothetical protein
MNTLTLYNGWEDTIKTKTKGGYLYNTGTLTHRQKAKELLKLIKTARDVVVYEDKVEYIIGGCEQPSRYKLGEDKQNQQPT